MPRFNPLPSSVKAAGFLVLPKDTYVLKIGTPKAFLRKATVSEGEDAKQDSYGVRIPLTVTDGPRSGDTIYFSCFQHTEGGMGIAKNFQMAAYGFDPNNKQDPSIEEEFNKMSAELGWGFDTDSGICENGWTEMEGKHIGADLGLKMYKDKEQQTFDKWLVYSA